MILLHPRRCGYLLLFVLMTGVTTPGWAAQRTEQVDENGDNVPIKAEADNNNDGKPDSFVKFEKGVRTEAEADNNYDGKIDYWIYYDDKGMTKRTARDNNKDSKPDTWIYMVQGRSVVLKEYDINYDGKVDNRALMVWKYDNNIKAPRYVPLWRESDNNFDGVIDVYTSKGTPGLPADRKGQPIETSYTQTMREEDKTETGKSGVSSFLEDRQALDELVNKSRRQ